MFFDVVLIVVLGTSIWVYFDARSIGVRKGQVGGLADMGPAGWLVACLLLWIVTFPLYLAKRELFKLAKQRQAYPSSMQEPARQVRQCPFCAEDIRALAIKCKHCGSDVEPIHQAITHKNPLEEVSPTRELSAIPLPMRTEDPSGAYNENAPQAERRIGTAGIVGIVLLCLFLFAAIVSVLGPSTTTGRAVESANAKQGDKVAQSSKVNAVEAGPAKVAAKVPRPAVPDLVQPPPPKPRANAQLRLLSSRGTLEHGFSMVRGQVKNLTSRSLENVVANVSFFDSKGNFIKSEESLIDYNPILPGQVSPFEVITTYNPEMAKFSTEFKFLFGGTLSMEDVSN